MEDQNSFTVIFINSNVLINGIPDIGAHLQVLPHLVQISLTLNVDRLIS